MNDITVSELFVLFNMQTGSDACHQDRMELLQEFGKTCSLCRYAAGPLSGGVSDTQDVTFKCNAPQFGAGRLMIAHMDKFGCGVHTSADDK